MYQLRLNEIIEDRGFPAEYVKHFLSMMEPVLDKMDEVDRLVVESVIPTILEYGEESWLPHLPSITKLNKLLDPSRAPQSDGNRE